MEDGLGRVRTIIENKPVVAVGVRVGQLLRNRHHLCEQARVSRCEFSHVLVLRGFRHHENVHRGLRVDIGERDDALGLCQLFHGNLTRDDLRENGVLRHATSLSPRTDALSANSHGKTVGTHRKTTGAQHPGKLCNNIPVRSFFLMLLAAICFGTTGTSQALAGVDASPLAVGASRLIVGGGVLGILALALWAKDRGPRSSAISNTATPKSAPDPKLLVALGVLGILAYQPTFFAGTALSGVALGTVVGIGSSPIFTGVIDSVLRRRLPSGRWMFTTALAICGVLMVSGIFSGSTGASVNPLGILASLGAGASYSVITLASKGLSEQGWSPTQSMGTMFGVSAVFSLPILFLAGAAWLANPRGIALALWLGLVTVVAAYLLFASSLAHLSANTVATITLAEPLTATLLGVFVLHERLDTLSIVGLTVLGAALVLLALPARRQRVAQPA